PLRRGLEHEGVRFKTSSDTEVIAELLARTSGLDLLSVLRRSLPRLQGAYCLLVLTRDSLVGVRDPLGIRPLCLGRLPDGGAIMASETCALDTVGAELVREIEPGEAVLLGQGPPKAEQLMPSTRKAMCMFEFIYFARPDSRLQGQSLYEARRNMGRELAREAPAEADIVISLPDSGTPAAVGFAEASGIPYSEGLIKSRYITRTFIQP
ncbi:MAG: amidophosphoribosyltransferase, partial [Chloroflexi bacterium]